MLRILPGSLTAGTTGRPPVSLWRPNPIRVRAPSGLEARASGRPGEPGLEAEDRLRVEVRDTGLGDAEHLADLAEGQLLVGVERDGQLLVVVERDQQLLPLGATGDRVGDPFPLLGPRERALGVGRVRVFDGVD